MLYVSKKNRLYFFPSFAIRRCAFIFWEQLRVICSFYYKNQSKLIKLCLDVWKIICKMIKPAMKFKLNTIASCVWREAGLWTTVRRFSRAYIRGTDVDLSPWTLAVSVGRGLWLDHFVISFTLAIMIFTGSLLNEMKL